LLWHEHRGVVSWFDHSVVLQNESPETLAVTPISFLGEQSPRKKGRVYLSIEKAYRDRKL
jgi:hypothetical protein